MKSRQEISLEVSPKSQASFGRIMLIYHLLIHILLIPFLPTKNIVSTCPSRGNPKINYMNYRKNFHKLESILKQNHQYKYHGFHVNFKILILLAKYYWMSKIHRIRIIHSSWISNIGKEETILHLLHCNIILINLFRIFNIPMKKYIFGERYTKSWEPFILKACASDTKFRCRGCKKSFCYQNEFHN